MTPTQEQKVQQPDTEPYRIVIGGAVYDKPTVTHDLEGNPKVIYVSQFGVRGEVIDLIKREAVRLSDLGAVRPASEAKGYDEMGEDELRALTDERRLTVRSSGADADIPLRDDYINALLTYEAGGSVVTAASGPGGIVATASGGSVRRVDEVTGEPRADGAVERVVDDGGSSGLAADLTEAQLAHHIETEKLTGPQTVELAQDDPALAVRVLEAERIAQGGDPRTNVEKQLQKIIGAE